ncbi:MAG: 5-(carboxyamino)imidazole ribonucleotide mutase [Bacteroidales bacterium]|nr:5-(carboxyamino)imidazole ribonucleotide mutase [Bacteroidales bacterium]
MKVGVLMGSKSDWGVMSAACEVLEEFGVPYEKKVLSAHRTPAEFTEYMITARSRGLSLVIAGAGGAAHLPGMAAALTTLPVIGVPIKSAALSGVDSLLSIVQMPSGIPVATMAIDGARNAALYAVSVLALQDASLEAALAAFRKKQADKVLQTEL